jgi:drug/metabolite transporter (DMT)-like permease
MSLTSIGLILLSAVFHASWNAISKRSTDKIIFFWLSGIAASVCLLPVLIGYWQEIPPIGWLLIVLSSAFEAIYLLCLAVAYEAGDLSLAYPLSRGSVPLFVLILATVFIGERVTALGILGIALSVLGIYVLHLRSLQRNALLAPFAALRGRATQFALLAGICTAVYSTIDKRGITYVNPMLYTTLIFWGYSLLLTPFMLRKRAAIVQEWREGKWRILAVGVLSIVTYLLVTYVLLSSPASYVSALRGISIVFGAVLGALFLKEHLTPVKTLGAVVIFTGMICIALAKP